MEEKEQQAAEARKKELETLLVKKEADALFAKNEEEKRRRRVDETKGLQGFHLQQIVSHLITSVLHWSCSRLSGTFRIKAQDRCMLVALRLLL